MTFDPSNPYPDAKGQIIVNGVRFIPAREVPYIVVEKLNDRDTQIKSLREKLDGAFARIRQLEKSVESMEEIND